MSSVSRASSPKNMADDYDESAEESGWTTYFEDFFNNQNNNNNNNNIDGDNNNNNNNNNNSHQNGSMNYLSGVDSSSSLVSDAASLAARKVDGDYTNNLQGEEELSKKSNRSSFSKSRRKKIKTAFVDDALEDTASSPLNSPKVLYENQLHKTNQKEEQRDPFQEKGNRSGGQGDDERKEEFGFDGRDSDCTQLKKRGLCLVPLSMVLKYI